MLYTLPNFKTIEISLEVFLNMTDEDEEYLMAYGYGEYIEDPFFASSLFGPVQNPDDATPDITSLNSAEKLSDLDLEVDPEQ